MNGRNRARPGRDRGPRIRRRSIGSLLLIRVLLIANGLTLLTIGALYVIYGSRPGGLAVGGVLIAGAVLLFSCIPLTDPYRHERRRSQRG
jgi:hypothetical protein